MLSQRPSIVDRGSFRSGLGMAQYRVCGDGTKEVLRNDSVGSGIADRQCRVVDRLRDGARVRRRSMRA
ncbi:hypothetical protein PTKU64_44500 [Paraburkholderia terrae]|uniref:Uncharacterized protein n=1 Tax=Paraburkholderia terrae TaxID=311230 RepID=A0ABM7TQX4_9BURK|nr:hypothetical protein PTKU64_44500 [Paraburkholderia terrae]BDC40757.1 hypothetical protein PTKU15_40540 [Paraburkholderia terrae]